jgi:hypothetical protein
MIFHPFQGIILTIELDNKKLRDIESLSFLPDFLSGNGPNKTWELHKFPSLNFSLHFYQHALKAYVKL